MVNIFNIRVYGRTELAQRYFPDMTAKAAWKKLKSWIEGNKELKGKLQSLNYNDKRRTFTPAEVKAIIYYLDDPE